MSIKTLQAQVYYAPTAGKRYFTKRAAINKEARAIIKKYFPDERGCPGGACSYGDPGWTMEVDQPERWARYYRLLTAALKKTMQ